MIIGEKWKKSNMLYFIHGTDSEKIRKEAQRFVSTVKEREPHVAHIRIIGDTFNKDLIQSYAGAQGLFVEKVLIVLDGVFEGDSKDDMKDLLPLCGESNNIFLGIAGTIPAKLLEEITKISKKLYTFDIKEKVQKEDWNMFAIGNAWERGDSLKAWSAYRDARKRGIEPEVLAGILHSTIRRGIEKGNGERKEKMMSASRSLISIYHGARRGEWDLEHALEWWVLEK